VITLPETSPERYISGRAALNIPSKKGTGDWHFSTTFLSAKSNSPTRLFLVGTNCEINLNGYFGRKGIVERSSELRRRGLQPASKVWSASHARAIADMVTVLASEHHDFSSVRLDDWMPRDSDKHEVFSLLENGMMKMPAVVSNKIRSWMQEALD
jgi:hypothetical protein